ncbi:MAG TPA: bifunctional UDP-N-acetylglucosamine diphosphorylase/glucosamine-1-phosphate N-acetyltransferase GlmU [Fimbriimonadaceae bacterium]|jgi:bifunctional UDP-N-acetylglucosamine pyrophosphorylase/glucosamine-1-phosphate N-acetyltransferase
MERSSLAGIILAAGKGTRMKSDLPKALHSVCGVPMAELIARALKGAGVERPIVVVGHEGDLLVQALGEDYDYAWQTEQKGTGHAAMMTADLLKDSKGSVLITPGDTPLLSGEALKTLAEEHIASKADCTVATMNLQNPHGYGRIVRDGRGNVSQIVEDKDAPEEIRLIREINSGIYCFKISTLFEILPKLKNDNAQGEYYLTDTVREINKRGGSVRPLLYVDADLMMGVNDRWQLAEAARTLRMRILRQHAISGVTIVDPDSTYIGVDVEIGPDATIEPGTVIEGVTTIGAKSIIGPSSRVLNSTVGENCTVMMSHLNEATMLDGARCGPFANLRPRSVIGAGSKIGNFVEVKNATLGSKVSVSHLSYIGDGHVGDGTNIGAGTIFCNYDGFAKHRTEIGENAFVGSNTTLVAPVTIGDGAMIAAGSVITQSVPDGALGIGRQRQEVKEQWAAQWRKKKQSDKT